MDGNMREIVLTGWCGAEFSHLAAHTMPLIARYAERHGHSWRATNMTANWPPSWEKLMILREALRVYSAAVWIDADVVVIDGDQDIFAEVPQDSWQAMVEHETGSGTVPNCGVWVVTPAMLPYIDDVIKRLAPKYLHHGWWEQAAILELLGYTVTNEPHAVLAQPTELYRHTTFLPATWNHHPHDIRRVESPKFLHVTQYPDRLAAVKEFAAQSRV